MTGLPSDRPQAHACFRLQITFPLTLPAATDVQALWQSLNYRVLREPGDLLAHTRRIRLCSQPELQRWLPGALVDLHHVLGVQGQPLQQRLLGESRPVLDANWYRQFEQGLVTGDLPEPVKHAVRGRVLPSMAQLQRRRPAASPVTSSDGPIHG